jgi:hypothetical protein
MKMDMQDLREKFPDAEVLVLDGLVHAEEVGNGPWKLYIFGCDHMHSGGQWFTVGRIKYPDEEITFDRAKGRADNAVQLGMEVRVCDGMDHLVFHSENGKVVYGNTFWNEAKPDPTAGKVAKRLTGGKK